MNEESRKEEVTAEEIQEEAAELSQEDLEQVSGGGLFDILKKVARQEWSEVKTGE